MKKLAIILVGVFSTSLLMSVSPISEKEKENQEQVKKIFQKNQQMIYTNVEEKKKRKVSMMENGGKSFTLKMLKYDVEKYNEETPRIFSSEILVRKVEVKGKNKVVAHMETTTDNCKLIKKEKSVSRQLIERSLCTDTLLGHYIYSGIVFEYDIKCMNTEVKIDITADDCSEFYKELYSEDNK